ncbi:hypothetical protein QBC35DRAFT_77249 [Podospora australis]|uniref:Uncharacterized protein n=1 Tax=Podospora australis TaxID=1536484 RepID=A0AAN6WMC9_9PEZI|nr:hypothetical protein QBC35DRAFT_77249 [Podospora australis]
MGNWVGLTGTSFVGTDEKSAVTSYQPCHIFGDQMLIGSGIRLGFYLIYAAAIVAVLFGVDKHFRLWHNTWNILALALFISMFLNVVDFNLIIIDYAILIHLVLWYPVYFVFTILFRQAFVVDSRSHPKSEAEYRQRLENCREAPVSDLDVARAQAYSEVLKSFALYAAVEESGGDLDAAQVTLSNAIQHYVSHWHEQIEYTDGPRQERPSVDGGAVTTVFNNDLVEEIAAAPTRADIEKLRDLYVAALVHSDRSVVEARATEQEVALIASEELRIKRRPRKASSSLRHFLLTSSYKDQVTAAIGLLVWSCYMFGTAALNWPLLRNGNKEGGACDNFPTVYFVLAPKKPFADSGFRTFLRVWTVGVCLVAVITTAVAIYTLLVSILGPRALGLGTRRHKKNKKSAESNPQDHGYVHDISASPGYSRKARSHHTQDILTCLHHTQTRTVKHRYQSRATTPIHFSLWNIPWAILLAVLLIVAITCAELTVKKQGPNNDTSLDFARPALHETSEILALLIGLYTLVLTLLSVFGAWVASLRGQKRHHQTGSDDLHRYRREKVAQPGQSQQPALVG